MMFFIQRCIDDGYIAKDLVESFVVHIGKTICFNSKKAKKFYEDAIQEAHKIFESNDNSNKTA